MNEIKTFEDVRKYLYQIPYIGNGGCGISAFAMYKWLQKNGELSSDFKFVICYDTALGDEYINNMQVLRDGNGTPKATSHIAIHYNGQVIDCIGSVYLPKYDLVQFVRAEWFLIKMINNIGSWNTAFDRSYLLCIEKELNIDLSEINN